MKNIIIPNLEAKKELEVDDPHKISVLFYNLKKKGWIDIKRSEEDKRLSHYNILKMRSLSLLMKMFFIQFPLLHFPIY